MAGQACRQAGGRFEATSFARRKLRDKRRAVRALGAFAESHPASACCEYSYSVLVEGLKPARGVRGATGRGAWIKGLCVVVRLGPAEGGQVSNALGTGCEWHGEACHQRDRGRLLGAAVGGAAVPCGGALVSSLGREPWRQRSARRRLSGVCLTRTPSTAPPAAGDGGVGAEPEDGGFLRRARAPAEDG